MEVFQAVLTSIYSLLYIVSLLSNCTVILTILIKKNKKTSNSINPLILNMTISDLIFLLLSTFDAITFHKKRWIFGNTFCIIQAFTIETNYTTSITTLTLISFERYIVICKPFSKFTFLALGKPIRFLILIWTLSTILQIPITFAYRVENGICTNSKWGKWPRFTIYSIYTVSFFVIPALVISVSHFLIIKYLYKNNKIISTISYHAGSISNNSVLTIQQRKINRKRDENKKLTRTLLILSISFFLSWTPFVSIRMLKYANITIHPYIWPTSQIILIINTAVNPFLYGLSNNPYSNVISIIRSFLQSRIHLFHTGLDDTRQRLSLNPRL